MGALPRVAILVPTLNEEKYVARAINSLTLDIDDIDYELIVLDGGSSDCTCEIVRGLSVVNPRIKLVPNEGRFQSAAINKGARIARPETTILVRADCHAEYPKGYVAGLITELRRSNATSVVVPMRAIGETYFQRAIAAAQNSRLGNGGAAHRCRGSSRYIEHGHHAAFDRAAFLAAGGYDETFTHNEDAEFDLRLTRSGAQIWLCSDLTIGYFPRKNVGSLARQYFKHGVGRARTLQKHRSAPKFRQAIPIGVLAINVGSLSLGALASWIWLMPFATYWAACLLWGSALALARRDRSCFASGFMAAVIHHSWACGFVYAWLRRNGSVSRRSFDEESTIYNEARETS